MLDLVIRGGRVVTPQGVGAWDLGVQGERIAVLAEPGSLPSDADLPLKITVAVASLSRPATV